MFRASFAVKKTPLYILSASLLAAAAWITTGRGPGVTESASEVPPQRASSPSAPLAVSDRQVRRAAEERGNPEKPSASSLSDLIEAAGDPADPENRRRAVAALREAEDRARLEARRLAEERGLPLRIEGPDGRVQELMRLEDGRPIYYTTHNVSAAISTGADVLQAAPFSLTGDGTVGVWDAGSARSTHREFGGRSLAKDGASPDNHATHVAGTIAAAGVSNTARGMAPTARIDSYNWSNDRSEMLSRGASYPAEPGMLAVSNHSYGVIAGWQYTGQSSPAWRWWGSGTTRSGTDPDFGQYNASARDADALAAALPYYLIFRSAGNDRSENPSSGDPVALSPSGGTTATYSAASHPGGDGAYRDGHDTISFEALAKNVITIGAVNDAVTSGTRDVKNAAMTSFSSWGPTDDGRIKPDIVANGATVHSTLAGGDAAYGTYSGTSMSSPNAAGTAQLLVDLHGKLFPGQAMRASTLKALLIHTADDLGTPGPDYRFGWGLLDGQAAAETIRRYHERPNTRAIVEGRLDGTTNPYSQTFTWDGKSPIRATLAWTDPAGSATTGGDSRTRRLVHDLELRVLGPDGKTHLPFVMPFVGNWSSASLSAPAVTGINSTDNVEQVHIAAPAAAGSYTVTVSHAGSLAKGSQVFSLILDGAADGTESPAPVLESAAISTTEPGPLVVTLSGRNLQLGARVQLVREGLPDVEGAHVEALGNRLVARFDTRDLLGGAWSVVVVNPDGASARLANAVTVAGADFGTWARVRGLAGEAASDLADPDGDGFANIAEFHLDTDPSDANSVLALAVQPATGSALRLVANRPIAAGTATVESAPSPAGPWTPFATVPAGETTPWSGAVSRAESRRFFRLRYDPPQPSTSATD